MKRDFGRGIWHWLGCGCRVITYGADDSLTLQRHRRRCPFQGGAR